MAAAWAAALDFFFGDLAADAVGDVFADGAREQERLLFHDADVLAQELARVALQLDPIQRRLPLV